MGQQLTIPQFLPDVPHWYEIYIMDNPSTLPLEKKIQRQAVLGFLRKQDLKQVAYLGGNAHGIAQRMDKWNTEAEVQMWSAEALQNLSDRTLALRAITRIRHWGESFGSKTLAFLAPGTYPVLDSKVRKCLATSTNWTGRYEDFARLCEYIAREVPVPNPQRPAGVWLPRDIEMALFQFAWPPVGSIGKNKGHGGADGRIVGPLPV